MLDWLPVKSIVGIVMMRFTHRPHRSKPRNVSFPRLAKEQTRNGIPLALDFLDVKKAYFNGLPKRDVYMQLPRELGLPSHFVAKQVRCVYSTRDAGAIWEDTYRETLESSGFVSGVASPCCFFHPQRCPSTVVHGDDITTLGEDAKLDWLWTQLTWPRGFK